MGEKSKEKFNNIFDEFFHAATTGNLGEIESCLKNIENVDVTNRKGWTALMIAAKNGHSDVVKELLKKGSDPMKINSTGQTAQDMAEFWLHGEIVNLLSTSTAQQDITLQRRTNYLCDNPLDRSSHRRTDHVWMEKALTNPSSVFIVLSGLCPLVYPLSHRLNENVPDDIFSKLNSENPEVQTKLARFNYNKALILSPKLSEYYIFLGREITELENEKDLNNNDSENSNRGKKTTDYDCINWFAVETKLTPSELQTIEPGLTRLPFPLGFSSLMRSEAAIVCQARSVMAWHDRNQFCATCGSGSVPAEAGYKRACLNEACRSNKGAHNTCYPRLDPTVIMAISCPENRRLLLGRNKRRHIPNMWSVLAGFMEPGESIEEACRREVYEETRINVGEVTYHSSQPWPMPSTLMIGCVGRALDGDIVIDESELAEARWFGAPEVRQMLARTHPESLILPPPQAIAHQLVLQWLSTASSSSATSPSSTSSSGTS